MNAGQEAPLYDGEVVDLPSESGRRLRDHYPPILRGNDKEVHVVSSGEDALALWSECDRGNRTRPTVIVVHENVREATSLRHTRALLARSEKPITVHPDSKMDPKQRAVAKANLEVAAKKPVVASPNAAPREQARAAGRAERIQDAAAQHEESAHRSKPGM